MISFKGAHVPKPVITFAVYFYLRYGVSYRDLEEIMAERGVTVDDATLNRWGVKHAPEVAKMAQKRITIDKGRSNGAGITEITKIFKRRRIPVKIDTVRSKYLNNRIEQDHRFIKRMTRPMLGFKCFASAAATLEGIEVAHMIRKCQLGPGTCGFRQFAQLADELRPATGGGTLS